MGRKNSIDTSQIKNKFDLVAIVQGLFLTLLLLMFSSLALAMVVFFSNWQINYGLLNMLAHISVIGGAIWTGKKASNRAWLNGVVVGILAFLILTWIGENQNLFASWLWWTRFFRMGLVAMLGGILGGLFSD